ncbi:MAG: hypothetical protein WD751_10565 [Anaerolineales bacterium]
MKHFASGILILFAAIFFALSITLLSSRDSNAATPADDCVANFGTWAGATSDDGTCTYAANSNFAISHCGADYTYTETFDASEETVATACTLVVMSTFASPQATGYGGCGNEVRGPLPQPIKISLCNGKNGTVTFPIGACELKCTITSRLPAAAARKLPGSAEATIYVRVVDAGGTPGDDSYTVCFSLGGLGSDPPAIYRFISGKWTLLAIGNSESQFICARGAADGAYYLGEPPKES